MRLGDQIEALLAAGCRIFHVDVGDGQFIPPITIGPIVVQSVTSAIRRQVAGSTAHLMIVVTPLQASPGRRGDGITFHVEVCDDVPAAVTRARSSGSG